MGVKLQLVLGLILLWSVWIPSGVSVEINSPKPQEHQNDDKHTNVIEKLPKTETEIKYVNKNTPTTSQSNSETKQESGTIDDHYEKQNEVEKDTSTANDNVIKKDAAPKRREGSGRSIDIEKYISPEFQNNEFTLPVSSDTEKYLDEPFSFKTSPRMGSDYDHTTSKTSMFRKFTEPIQKLEQEFEDRLKGSEHDHHADFGDEHIDLGNDHEDEHDLENEEQESDHDLDHEGEDPDIDDMTVDKMIERSESVPTNISMGWEMKISKDDPDKNSKNLKSFTVVKYRKVDYIKHFNDTKVFLNEPKGDPETLNTTTTKPLTTTTRKNNLLTKPPTEQNNSHLLSNKIETETIKAINLVTTDTPSTKKAKGDEGSLLKEQISQENQITAVVTTPVDQNSFTESVTDENTTNDNKEITTIKSYKADGTTTPKILPTQRTTTLQTTDENLTNENKETKTVNENKAYKTTTIKISPTQETASKTTIENTKNENQETTTIKDNKEHQTAVESLPTQRIVSTTTEKLPKVNFANSDSTVQPTTEVTSLPETTTPEESYPTSTEFPKEDIYLGTDVTTTTDEEITTEFEAKTTQVRSFKTKSTASQVTDRKFKEPLVTSTPSIVTDVPSSTEIQSTNSQMTSESTLETSTTDNIRLVNKIKVETTTETEEFTTLTESPVESTTKTVDTTENLAFTSRISEIMSDGTTIMPEESTAKESISTKMYSVTETKIASSETSATTAVKPVTEAVTTEVSFVHIETIGANHTTFVPETLSPNFNYPITDIDNKERAISVITGSTSTQETTTADDSEDTTNTSSATENIVNDPEGSNKGKIAAIVISTVGAVCLVILAGLLYIMKKRQRKFNYKQRCRPVSLDDYSVDNLSAYNSVRRKGADRQSKRSYGNPAFEDPSVPSHPLNFPALAKFATIVEDMKAEFEEIPQISARASELPEGCETKNRYANVIPLPETRVYLKTVESVPNSDYINANYVTGPKNTRGYYIACQAPKQNTVDDFWRMVWEQQCRVILMITHLFENGVEKCADYLPPSEVLDCHRLFGDFQVTLKKREAKEKYIISSIQLKNMVSNSWRDVTHFWYLGWPEKGIPSEANSLIAFLIEARSYMKASTLDKNISPNDLRNDPSLSELNPVVVHCSPGTGRTGVLIACDIAIREFEKTRLVDIPKIVYKIRRDRANAVQTKEQYMFIYKVISLYATKLTGGALDSF